MPEAPGVSANPIDRRTFLAACTTAISSCTRSTPEPPGPKPFELPLERFPTGVRVTVSVSGQPVEILRSSSGVTARSLLCTHQGCEVFWSDDQTAYLCPCHEGKFDAYGRPKEGPPPAPLKVLATRIEGPLLLVGP